MDDDIYIRAFALCGFIGGDWFRPDAAADVLRALQGLDDESLACTILIAALDAEGELERN